MSITILVERIQHLVPSSDCGQYLVRLFGPLEWLRVFVVLDEELVDGLLQLFDGLEHAASEAPFGEFGKESLDGVEPGGGCRRKVEGPPRVRRQPFAHLGVFMGGVVIDDGVDMLAGRHGRLDRVEEADIFLVAMLFHATANDFSIQHVERGEQRGGAMALVIMRHRAAAALLQRQARLRAVECLYLAFLVDRQHDGVRGRADIEADDIAKFGRKLRIVGKLELARAVRLQTMPTPNPLHRTHADALQLRHGRRRPMRRLVRRRAGEGRLHDARLHLGAQRWQAWRPGLVTQQARDTLGHKPLLPAPDGSFAGTAAQHNRRRAVAVGGQQNDPRPPDMFLQAVPVRHHRFQFRPVLGSNSNCDPIAHPQDSHASDMRGILSRTQMYDFIH